MLFGIAFDKSSSVNHSYDYFTKTVTPFPNKTVHANAKTYSDYQTIIETFAFLILIHFIDIR